MGFFLLNTVMQCVILQVAFGGRVMHTGIFAGVNPTTLATGMKARFTANPTRNITE